MKCNRTILLMIACLVLIGGATTTLASPSAVELSRYVIGGGGGFSQAAPYELNGTIGQPVVGIQENSPYKLCSGFWCGLGTYSIYMPNMMR